MEEGQERNNQAQSSRAIPPSRSFFPSFSPTLVSSLSLSLSPRYPACQATQVLRVTCCWLGSLSTEPSPLLHPPPQLLLLLVLLLSPPLPPPSPRLPLSLPSTLPRGETVRPSSPELSISKGVYLQRDRPTHLEHIFTSVHTLFSLSLLAGRLRFRGLPPDAFLQPISGPFVVVATRPSSNFH